MLEIRVDSLTVHKGQILLGCVITGPEGAWVRFAQCKVPVSLLEYGTICDLMDAWDVEPENDPLQPTLPYTG